MLTIIQVARDPYGYMLAALQLQRLYFDRNVAADKTASVTAVVDKRKEEWKRLVTPAAGDISHASRCQRFIFVA
jgi:hypothetical protein